MRRHAASTYPEECCGVLVGTTSGEPESGCFETEIRDVLPADNEREGEARHERYAIAPQKILEASKDARARGLEIVGYYHSHPDHPALPSDFDREHAWPEQSYVIVSVRDGRPTAQRSWRLASDRSRFDEEQIRVG